MSLEGDVRRREGLPSTASHEAGLHLLATLSQLPGEWGPPERESSDICGQVRRWTGLPPVQEDGQVSWPWLVGT